MRGLGRSRGVAHARGALQGCQRGAGYCEQQRKPKKTGPWDCETRCHGQVNHGSPMGSLTRGSRKNALKAGTELSVGVRVGVQAPGLMACVHVGSRLSGARGTWKRLPPGLQLRMDDNQLHPEATCVLQPVRDGEWWNVVESNAALLATAIHTKPACRHPKGCAGGG